MNSSTPGAPTRPHPRSAAVSSTTCFSSVTSADSICWKRGASSAESEDSKRFVAHTSLIATYLPSSISRTTRLAISTGWRPLRNVLEKRPSTRPPSRRSKSRRFGTIAGCAAAVPPQRPQSYPWARGDPVTPGRSSAVDDDRAGDLVVQGLSLPVPEHPEVVQQRDQPRPRDERSEADDQLQDRPEERLAPTHDVPVGRPDPDPDGQLPQRPTEEANHQGLIRVRHDRDAERPGRVPAHVGGHVDALSRGDGSVDLGRHPVPHGDQERDPEWGEHEPIDQGRADPDPEARVARRGRRRRP